MVSLQPRPSFGNNMVLQAFIDDSSSEKGDKRLFMAGYLNRSDKWALFTKAWDEELKTAPSIAYLRMVEANGLRGQFGGWGADARNKKLRSLARVINHFQPLSFQFTINRGEFFRVLKPVSPRGLGNPHFTCSFSVIAGVARYVAGERVKVPIEFIFDEQEGVDTDLIILFHEMVKKLPRSARKLISGVPVFRNDKDTPPLQAADMLAWHLRREHDERVVQPNALPMADLLRNANGHLMSHIDDNHIQSWADYDSRQEGVALLQSKRQWQKFKHTMSQFAAAGLIPPRGNYLRHLLFRFRIRILSVFARREYKKRRRAASSNEKE